MSSSWRLTIEANGHTFYVRHQGAYYHVVIACGSWPSFASLTEYRSLARQMARRLVDETQRSDLLIGDDTTDTVQATGPARIIEIVIPVHVRLSDETYRALAREYRQYASDAHHAFEEAARRFAKPRAKKGQPHATRNG